MEFQLEREKQIEKVSNRHLGFGIWPGSFCLPWILKTRCDMSEQKCLSHNNLYTMGVFFYPEGAFVWGSSMELGLGRTLDLI